MRRLIPFTALVAVPLIMSTSACTEARDRYVDAVETAGELPDRVRFCLSVTRAVNAVQSASPDIAQDAIEEAVAQAPEDLLADVRDLADQIRDSRANDPGDLDDALATRARDLRDRVSDLCDPST